MWSDVLELVTYTSSKSSTRDVIDVPEYHQVYANKKSIRMSEHYQSMATALRPELSFEVLAIEYNGEQEIRYNNKHYKVIRVFEKDRRITELICQGLVNKGSGQ